MSDRAGRCARVDAQGKINLFLRILGRDADGYHRLETLFQRIGLADDVTVHTGTAGRTIDCTGADTGPAEQNLAWRAAVAFAEAAGDPMGFRIEIVKRIPVGGGLGGGSADAAAVLRALNALAARPLHEHALAAIAFSLGADVPYLLSAHALALGSGRGERLLPLTALPPRHVVLAVPSFGVSSRSAFGWYAQHGAGQSVERYEGRHAAGTSAGPRLGPTPAWGEIAALAGNDLEAVVAARHPEIAALKSALQRDGAAISGMSGSGSTVFGVYEHPRPAAVLRLDPARARVLVTTTVEQVGAVVVS